MQLLYRQDIVQNSLNYIVSALLNIIVEKCDGEGLKDVLYAMLEVVLGEV